MSLRNIIVIGASAGGFEAIKQLVAALPHDLNASILIVWHMGADLKGILPHVLNREKGLYAVNAIDREPLLPGRIYVAPPDYHLLVEQDIVRVTHGPKENGFRPAVDPLFRSAAFHYGSRVIGIVLSGGLDDGTSGLFTVKQYGGITIVQDPLDAEVPSMPENAIRATEVDYIVPVSEMAELLVKLTAEEAPLLSHQDLENKKKTEKEVRIAIQDHSMNDKIMHFGELTMYTCPDCHGVLAAIKEGGRTRYRCHTGHAFSANALLSIITKDIEDSLWNTIRSMEESIILLNHMGDQFAEDNQSHLAALYFQKANEAMNRAKLVRKAVLDHERLNPTSVTNDVVIDAHPGRAV